MSCVKQRILSLFVSKTYPKYCLKRPRLNTLRTFEAAGQRLSFTEAAIHLNISQAAVSQQMRNLEVYLNTRLFIRQNRRLSLTRTGQAYLDVVHEALDRLDTVTDQLFPANHNHTVTLRCTSAIATLWLAPQLKSLQNLNPNIDLHIKTLDQFTENEPKSPDDLEIFIEGEKAIDAQTQKLLTATIIPVCSPGLFSSRQLPINAAELLNFDLIHVLGYKHDWHRWFRVYHKDSGDIPGGLTVDGSLIAIEAALRGDGIMLGRRPFIDRYLDSGELIEVFSQPYSLHTDYYLHQAIKAMSRPECKIVANWLKKLA